MILQVLIAMVAGWINRHQQHVITYLKEENRTFQPCKTCMSRVWLRNCQAPLVCADRQMASLAPTQSMLKRRRGTGPEW